MLGISGNCAILFKTDGPRMLACATPSRSSIRKHSRKYHHAGKAGKFGAAIDGVRSLAGDCAARSLLSATPQEPRTILARPRAISVDEKSFLPLRLLTHTIARMEFAGLDLGRTL